MTEHSLLSSSITNLGSSSVVLSSSSSGPTTSTSTSIFLPGVNVVVLVVNYLSFSSNFYVSY